MRTIGTRHVEDHNQTREVRGKSPADASLATNAEVPMADPDTNTKESKGTRGTTAKTDQCSIPREVRWDGLGSKLCYGRHQGAGKPTVAMVQL